MQSLPLADLRFRSVFKLGYLASLALSVPFFLLAALLALRSGSTAIQLNGQPVHGLTALTAAVVGAIVAPLVPAAFLTLGTMLVLVVGGRRVRIGLRARPPAGPPAVGPAGLAREAEWP